MLVLKRVQYFNDFIRCQVTKEILTYGHFYYEDDEDGFIVGAVTYRAIKDQKRFEEFDYSRLEKASSQREYEQLLKEYETNFLTKTVLERKVQHKGAY